MMILIYLSIVILLLVYYFLTKDYDYWEKRGVPYDKPFLIFGSLSRSFFGKEHFLTTLCQIYEKFSTPHVGFFMFNRPALLIRSPELIKKVLIKDFDSFMNRNGEIEESVDPTAFHSLFSSRDATWKILRSKLSPIFTSGKIKSMFELMKVCEKNLKKNLEETEIVDFSDILKRYTIDTITSCAFGMNSDCLKNRNSEIKKMSDQLLDPKTFVRNLAQFCFFFAPKLKNFLKITFADPQSLKYFIGLFKTAWEEKQKNNFFRNDLVDILINLKTKEQMSDDYKFDDIKLASQALVFFAGNDTTSNTLAFACYELANNKEIQNCLRNEIKDNFKENEFFTYEKIQKMKYLDMIFNETLRKYPVAAFLIRSTNTNNYTFDEIGVSLEKETYVFISTKGLHFDSQYFPDPYKFDPERFNDENKRNILPYTYLPFGEGPRMCIGQRFAQLTAKLALFSIIKIFELELTEELNKQMEFETGSVFLQPRNGVRLKIKKICQ